jgi:hypothetical protein
MRDVRISFGVIVLNGEPFLRYNLRALYPFAYQIIVVEGATPKAAHAATPDGHSIDGTLEVLRRFKAEEDPEHKLIIVTAEDNGYVNGFWPGEKDEQSQAYAKRATGDWLWQIDVDEFYQHEDLGRVLSFLRMHPETTCLTFEGIHFWGGFEYLATGGLFRHRRFQGELWGRYRRLFKWGPGYQYTTHRPPTVVDQHGRDTSKLHKRFAGTDIPGGAVRLFHYLLVFPFQFTRKGAYYEKQNWFWERNRLQKYNQVLQEVDLKNGTRVFDQHDTYNWLERFTGGHPAPIMQMQADLKAGRLSIELRHTDDIERLLADPRYRMLIAYRIPREVVRGIWVSLVYILYFGPRHELGEYVRRHIPRRWLSYLPTQLRARLER